MVMHLDAASDRDVRKLPRCLSFKPQEVIADERAKEHPRRELAALHAANYNLTAAYAAFASASARSPLVARSSQLSPEFGSLSR